MKKIIGLFLFIILFIPTIVYAKDIELVSLKPVYDESSGIVLNDATDDSFDVTFNAADQEIKFEAVIRNTTDKDIIVNNINVTSPTYNFMSYKVEGIELNDVLKSNEDKNITLIIKSEHSTDILQNFEDRIIVDVNGKYREIIPILDNPATGVFTFILLIPVWIIGTAIILLIKKKSNKSMFKMNMVLLIIVSTITVGRISALQVFNIKINGKVDYKSINIMEGRYKTTSITETGVDIIGVSPGWSSYITYNDPFRYDYSGSYDSSNLLFYYKYDIVNLTFVGDGKIPDEYDKSGDISQARDGSVMIYLKNTKYNVIDRNGNVDERNGYDAYIVADGKIYFPEVSSYFFEYFNHIESLNGLENTGTDYTVYMDRMFRSFAYDGIRVYKFNLDFSHWNLSNVITMREMFDNAWYNPSRDEDSDVVINFEGTDTSNVIDMDRMFHDVAWGVGDNRFKIDIKMNYLNVEKVKTFHQMFECLQRYSYYPTFELKGWTINGVVWDMFYGFGVYSKGHAYIYMEDITLNNGAESMFNNRAGHTADLGIKGVFKNFKIKGSCKDMFNGFFRPSYNDTVDNELVIENWDTSEVTDMNSMFYYGDMKEYDFSSFDTSKVTDMTYMFFSNYDVEKIYVSDKWSTESLSANGANCVIQTNSPVFENESRPYIETYNYNDLRSFLHSGCGGIFTDKNNPKKCINEGASK